VIRIRLDDDHALVRAGLALQQAGAHDIYLRDRPRHSAAG
jgi:hypothetical protein